MKKHGEKIIKGKWRGSRWCAVCGHYHGNLYVCKSYPLSLQKEIAEESRWFQKVPAQRCEEFLEEIRAVCRKYKFNIRASEACSIVVDNLKTDEEPIPSDEVEDFTSF